MKKGAAYAPRELKSKEAVSELVSSFHTTKLPRRGSVGMAHSTKPLSKGGLTKSANNQKKSQEAGGYRFKSFPARGSVVTSQLINELRDESGY